MPSSSRTAHDERLELIALSSASSAPMHSGSWHSSMITRRQVNHSMGTPVSSSANVLSRSAGSATRAYEWLKAAAASRSSCRPLVLPNGSRDELEIHTP